MGIKCDMKLDRQSYLPGQTVNCDVQLDFDGPKKVKSKLLLIYF